MTDIIRSLRLFLRLTEVGSFSALARKQNLSHTTISRAVDDLEAHFGVRLFQRSTRRLSLTGDGERLVEHGAAILDQISQAEADLAGQIAARGLVRIGVTTALGLHYAAALKSLKDKHPDLMVELIFSDWRNATDDIGLDLWITVGAIVSPAMVPLGELSRILVASPAYLSRSGLPQNADELLKHQCLTYGYAARAEPWSIDGKQLRVNGFLRANTSEGVLRATRGGLGIGLLPRMQLAEDLARGAIVQILSNSHIAPLSIMVAHGFRDIRMPIRVRAALDFLIEHFPGERV